MGLWRFELCPRSEQADPHGRRVRKMLADFGIRSIGRLRSARLFTIALDLDPSDEQVAVRRIAHDLLTDPVVETCRVFQQGEPVPDPAGAVALEVHLKPGVMDNVAHSVLIALRDMGIPATSAHTARRYELQPTPTDDDLEKIRRLLGNSCIEEVVLGSKPIEPLPEPSSQEFKVRRVVLRTLDAAALEALSREGHLFLSLAEMRAIQSHYRERGRDPTDLELETIAQTWSEHCVHKTLKAAVEYHGAPFPSADMISSAHSPRPKSPRPGPRGTRHTDRPRQSGAPQFTREYGNLLNDTIVRATSELIREGRGPTCLSVFKDNAGIIAFDDDHGIAFKVETHNHPSAIEPYGGAATGVGGCIRDILGCGLGAKPIANTDVFCLAPPDWPIRTVPKGVIHPRAVLEGLVAGVRDYGNRMGIPTVNGAVHFDPRYLGNPLVFCGCVGMIPRDRIEKRARPGDAIVLIGGRTGRDGIHGATFSSAELSHTHEDEFAHAVQIGNPIEEKKILDVILAARDSEGGCLYSAITDCGAGGLSSAVGEMGREIGAEVNLENVPLKYAGLRYDEIWISEAQERMVLAVPPENVDAFLALAGSEDVEATVIGHFTDTGHLVVRYKGTQVGNLEMQFLHHGLPKATRRAEWWPEQPPQAQAPERQPSSVNRQSSTVKRLSAIGSPPAQAGGSSPHSAFRIPPSRNLVGELKRRLGDPTIASKHWIVRQYDHEVQGRSVVKPLVGRHDGPSDAAVIRPRLDSARGIAIGCGLAPQWADMDPYWMAVAAIDEALRNVVCVGGDPAQTAVLDNFCWPRVDDPRPLGALVRACQACYDVAKTYGLPFISGKDSLNNEFAMNRADADILRDVLARQYPDWAAMQSRCLNAHRLAVPYTLLISAVSIIEDVHRCITAAPRLTADESNLFFIGPETADWREARLESLAALHAGVAHLVRSGTVTAAHDCSDGGTVPAVAEMAIASGLDTQYIVAADGLLSDTFAEPVSGYILAVDGRCDFRRLKAIPGITIRPVARLKRSDECPMFRFVTEKTAAEPMDSVPLSVLSEAWKAPLNQIS